MARSIESPRSQDAFWYADRRAELIHTDAAESIDDLPVGACRAAADQKCCGLTPLHAASKQDLTESATD